LRNDSTSFSRRSLRLGHEEPEVGALGATRLHPDLPTHRFDEVLDDGETESRPPHVPGAAGIDSVEALEDPLSMRRVDAGPVVEDLEGHSLRAPPRSH